MFDFLPEVSMYRRKYHVICLLFKKFVSKINNDNTTIFLARRSEFQRFSKNKSINKKSFEVFFLMRQYVILILLKQKCFIFFVFIRSFAILIKFWVEKRLFPNG